MSAELTPERQLNAVKDYIWNNTPDPSFEEFDKVQDVSYHALSIIREVLKFPEMVDQIKLGAACVIAQRGSGIYLPMNVGKAENTPDSGFTNKEIKYSIYALGKSVVLIQNPHFFDSEQNLELEKSNQLNLAGNLIPAGAISTPDGTIISVSGFTAEQDRAIALAAAVKSNRLSREQATEIAQSGEKDSSEYMNSLLELQY